jgi:hypothetical protein
MNKGQPNNNFNQGMAQPNNNNSNVNLQIINPGHFQNNTQIINSIENICKNYLQNNDNDAPKNISENLKNQFTGEWFVAIINNQENFEFHLASLKINDFIIFQFEQKNIYICKYV